MTRQTFLWTAAALLGIVVTGVLAWSASQLAGQTIGLASAPLSVADSLAPHPTTTQLPGTPSFGIAVGAAGPGIGLAPTSSTASIGQPQPSPAAAPSSTANKPGDGSSGGAGDKPGSDGSENRDGSDNGDGGPDD